MKSEGIGGAPEPEWLREAQAGGCYTEDITPSACLHAAFVRSPHAHAEILSIDTSASQVEGVVGIWTAADIPANVQAIPCIVPLINHDGTPRANPPRRLLALDKVRHEGEAVVLVIATSLRTALDAARAVVVAYRPLPAVTDAALALLDGAPNIWNGIPRNLCFDWQMGDEARVESAIKGASTVVELEITNNRVVVSPLETRAAIGWTDLSSGRRVLITSTQGVHWTRDVIARDVLGWDPDTLDVITPRVGGSFGAKIFVYPEQVLVLLAAERLGVAVKWIGTRDEAFLTDTQGRDHRTRIQLALDGDARFLALRADTTANLGAFLSNYAPFNPTTCGAPLLAGAYKIGCLYTRVKGALSNTPPVDSYRGAGRPEANYALERIIDVAAFKIGMDKVELRRRNLIGPNDFPYTTATGIRLSGGLFLDNLEKAAIAIEYSSYPKRKHRSKANGRLRGIGVANYLEANGGMALARIQEAGGLPRESARITFMPGGSLQVDIGTQSSGQGHRFSYRKILSDHLQIPRAAILVRQGRTDRLRQSTGTGGSKSLLAGSTALLQAGDLVIEKARLWAARSWGVVPQNVAWSEGYFVAKSRRATLLELAEAANDRSGNAHVFSVEACATIEAGTYGNGCHICELEVDPATGEVALLRYVCVNDFGEIVSQRNVKSQVHGGIAQGIGQSLYEDCRFDSCTGRLLTRDFGSYNLPQAKHMPRFEVLLNHGSRGSNRLGIKGCGESGASGAPPAVMNALQDALEKEIGLQATQIQMPATPDRIWNLLNPVLY